MFKKFYSPDDAGGAPPEPAQPAQVPDFAGEIRKGFEGLGAGLKELLPKPAPAKESYEWDDPAKFWLLPEGTPPEEQARLLHEKQTKYGQHIARQMIKDPEIRKEILGDLPEKLQKYDAAFQYFDVAKADNAEFVKSKDAIKKIMDEEGITYKAAKRIYDAEQKSSTPAAPPTAPRVPLPGRHATAPQSSVEPKGKATFARGTSTRARIKAIMREGEAEGKIKFGS